MQEAKRSPSEKTGGSQCVRASTVSAGGEAELGAQAVCEL